jgi:sortase A
LFNHIGITTLAHVEHHLIAHFNILGEGFRYLVDVQVGDQVMLYVGERGYPYVIEQKMVLPDRDMPLEKRQENARWIEAFPDERLTMVTCWPYTGNSHRVIVIAKPPPEPQDAVVTFPVE